MDFYSYLVPTTSLPWRPPLISISIAVTIVISIFIIVAVTASIDKRERQNGRIFIMTALRLGDCGEEKPQNQR